MRILVTGCSGRLGDWLIGALLGHPLVRRVAGTDVRPARRPDSPKFRYYPTDARDGIYLRALMEEENADAVFHLAFKAGETTDALDAETINIGGTLAVVEAAAKSARVAKLVILSSGYAYGARRGNQAFMGESEPLAAKGAGPAVWRRRMEEAVTRLLPDLRPGLQVSFIRTCAIAGGGKEAECPVVPFLKSPFGKVTLAVADPPLQCLTLEEAARVLVKVLDVPEFRGPYNLAPDDAVTLSSLCRSLGGARLRIPYPALWLAARAARRFAPQLGVTESMVPFLAHGVALDNRRIKKTLGVEFRVPSLQAFASELGTGRQSLGAIP